MLTSCSDFESVSEEVVRCVNFSVYNYLFREINKVTVLVYNWVKINVRTIETE